MNPESQVKVRDIGVLLLRLGIGAMFIFAHGWPKISGGPEQWEKVGAMGMKPLGIEWGLVAWGFMAAFTEFAGGICLALGFLTRLACVLMTITMAVAMHMQLQSGKGWTYPAELGIVFIALIFIGAGSISLDRVLFGRRRTG